MLLVMVALSPCKSYCYFYLLIQSGDVYTAAELTCKQMAKSRSSRPVAKLKTVSGHHPTGGVLSSWLGTDRFGGKSQRRDATADRFAP